MKSILKKIVIRMLAMTALALLARAGSAAEPAAAALEEPLYEAELIFPLETWHNHASCIVETPQGDLIVCWFHGSGERTADDVKIEGARRRQGARAWSGRFTMADTPGFPDTNCAMLIDPQGRLWLLWPTILANKWESALMKYKISGDYKEDGSPIWSRSEVLHVKPGPEFLKTVELALPRFAEAVRQLPENSRRRGEEFLSHLHAHAEDKLYTRLGWMTRAHPFVLDGSRLIVPLYHDGFSFSLMAISDNWGETWHTSTPLVGAGNIQPSIVQRHDGSLFTFMRDNGPPPKRLHQSESRDRGETWSPVVDSSQPNPGSGAEVIALRNGHWVLIGNDTERGRHSLAVQISEDEGKSWPWKRHLEFDPPGPEAGSYSYPSILQAHDGSLHASYSFHLNKRGLPKDPDGDPAAKSIKHAHFNEAWIRQGDSAGKARAVGLMETNLVIRQVDLSEALTRDRSGYPRLDPAKLKQSPERIVELSHRAVVLENRYVRAVILPEMGRIYSLIFKPTGHEELWINPVAKPLTGQQNDLGWWMAWGGVEFTLPRGEHGTTWALPWKFSMAEDGSGSKAVRMQVTEPSTGLEEMVEVRLAPDRAVFETEIQINNRSEQPVPFSHWMNAMCAPGGRGQWTADTEMIVPCQSVSIPDRPFNQWMLGERTQGFERNPLRWAKHWQHAGDLLITGLSAGFYGAFSHEMNEGVVRVFDRSMTPGMDIWTWGFPPDTETQRQFSQVPNLGYVELWGGTSTDFSDEHRRILQPKERMQWREWLYPFAGTQGLTFANPDVALLFRRNLEARQWQLGLFSTAAREIDCQIRLGEDRIWQKRVRVSPEQTFWSQEKISRAETGDLELELASDFGRLHVPASVVRPVEWGKPYLDAPR